MDKTKDRRISTNSRVAAGFSLLTFAVAADADQWRGGWHDGWGWGHMLSGTLMMLFIGVALVALVVLGSRWLGAGSRNGMNPPMRDTGAIEILERRYASGEIDSAEFEERMQTLREHSERKKSS